MENEQSLKNMISDSLQDIKGILDANTVTGNPITLPNGVTILPISKVSVGFASGGVDLPTKSGVKVKDFGGGGGTGVSVVPIGFLTVSPDGKTEMIPVAPVSQSPIEEINSILENAPQIFQKVKDILQSALSNNNSEPDSDTIVREMKQEEISEKPAKKARKRSRKE